MDERVVRTRAAVLKSATELLVDGGPFAVTVDAIVAHSGVAKSTIYRHWQSRDEILLDVMDACAPTLVAPAEGVSFMPAITRMMDELVAMFTDPEWTRVLPALLMLKSIESSIATFEEHIEKEQQQVLDEVLRRGIAEGILDPDLDKREAAAFLVGPLMFAQLTGTVDVTVALGRRSIEVFVAAHAASAARS